MRGRMSSRAFNPFFSTLNIADNGSYTTIWSNVSHPLDGPFGIFGHFDLPSIFEHDDFSIFARMGFNPSNFAHNMHTNFSFDPAFEEFVR